MADGDERSPGAIAPALAVAPAVLTHAVGTLVGWDPERGPLVTFPGHVGDPLVAMTTVPLDAATAQAEIAVARSVVLAFDRGRVDAPIIVGLLHTPLPAAPPTPEFDAEVDGQRVVVEGSDEIVLRCGLASITLRSNGRVVIRGTYVETRSRGVNRIRGGSVQIN